MIDPRLLSFLTVGRIKNFTRAAEMLNLTQPAVTKHIKSLEEQYGVSLISRKGRRIELTEEGNILFRYAQDIETMSAVVERKLKNNCEIEKRYYIGATLTIGEYILPPVLGEYKKNHPMTDIILQVHNTEEITKKLQNGEIDLGLVEGPFDRNKFIFKKIKDDELVLAASPKSKFAGVCSVKLEEVLKSRLILREEGSGTRRVLEDKLREIGFSPGDLQAYMNIGSIGAIKSLVESNLGYTVISKTAIKKEVQNGSLVIVPIENLQITREFNFIYTGDCPSDFVKDFITFLLARMK